MKPCVFCEKNVFRKLFVSQGCVIEECKNCGLVRTKDFKAPDYSKYHRDSEYKSSEKLFRHFFAQRYFFIRRFLKKGTVLDIGASMGTFLDIFKKNGWKTYGVEPSENAKIAKSRGHTVFHSTLENAKLKNSFFDLVVANHVLEHTSDPGEFIKICRRILKMHGYLYIDVPNFGSASSEINKQNWKYLLPKEHSFHFTPESLSKMLEANGFKIVQINTQSGIFVVDNPIAYLFDELTMMRKSFFYDLMAIPGNIVVKMLNRGTSLGILAKKEGL